MVLMLRHEQGDVEVITYVLTAELVSIAEQ